MNANFRIMKIYQSIVLGLLLSLAGLAAGADCSCVLGQLTIDKSAFNLFNPTPEKQLRDLDTDRPDKTNSPHTLDAGHVQLEMGLLGYSYDRHNSDLAPIRAEGWTWADTNLRIGLTNWGELQLAIPFYQSNRETDLLKHETQRHEGIGDLTVILKTNFWGNDKGETAGGMEFFVKTPTASHGLGNGKVEGGALILLGTKLPGDFDLGFNTGGSISANDEGGYHADIINSISISHPIAGPLSAYVEFFSSVPARQSKDWEGTVDAGLTCQIGKNLQLDAGINVGVTRAADDLGTFIGVSYRF